MILELLEKYDDDLPVQMDTYHAAYFVGGAKIHEGWLHLIRPPGGR